MGQKVHPIGFRVGVTRKHESLWYSNKKNIPNNILEDKLIRDYISKRLSSASVSKIYIQKTQSKVEITINTARPGLVIGKKGIEVEKLNEELKALTKKDIKVNIKEIKSPELDAELVGRNIAQQLEKRMPFRRVMKKALYNTMKMGAEGIKVRLSGRLGGAEMARAEHAREGRIPLQTLTSNIDYALVEAKTIWGVIGVKVWIYKGDVNKKRVI